MTAMPRSIEAQARAAADRLRPHADVKAMVAAASMPAIREGTMTTPASPIDNAAVALTEVGRHLTALNANPLLEPIARENLGHGLKPHQVDAVLTLIRDLEAAQAAAPAVSGDGNG